MGPSVWHNGSHFEALPAAVESLFQASAVRTHCAHILEHAQHDELTHLTWHPEVMSQAVDYVVQVIGRRFPDFIIPLHSRWRHIEPLGYSVACRDEPAENRREWGRRAIDLVIPSALLDGGAGPKWRYKDPHLGVLQRSEGLACASLALFRSGALSAHPKQPCRTDAVRLSSLTSEVLAEAFQAGSHNPLVGLNERAGLLRRLGDIAQDWPEIFGAPARLGNIIDYLEDQARNGQVSAPDLLHLLLCVFAPLWAGRPVLLGVPLGDCWQHPASRDGYIPLHKLSQWLIYSLIEPLACVGLSVTHVHELTGLAEYRNGGLLLDIGLLAPRDPRFLSEPQTVDCEAVVEWRALTVSVLDLLLEAVSERLNLKGSASLSLTQLMEGGTWAAGRELALKRRPSGNPPVTIQSNGTVF